ncbi:MAG: hypothetical protein JWN10_1035, partial [Solirubrobacterales bacterium]|nr:hypothetical protein [Solirubrobacterales bacterium]
MLSKALRLGHTLSAFDSPAAFDPPAAVDADRPPRVDAGAPPRRDTDAPLWVGAEIAEGIA